MERRARPETFDAGIFLAARRDAERIMPVPQPISSTRRGASAAIPRIVSSSHSSISLAGSGRPV